MDWVELEPGSLQLLRRGRSGDRIVVTSLAEPRGVVRRWAASHLLRRGLTDLTTVMARLDSLSAHDADSVVAGVLEAIEALPGPDAARAISMGLAAGTSNTRIRRVAGRAPT